MRLLPLLALAALAIGCTATADEDVDSSEAALSQRTLTAAACTTPDLRTKAATNAAGEPIAGTAITNISGCIVGKTGETGKDVMERLVAVLGDTPRIGRVMGPDGKPVFAKFTPGQISGSLATELAQDVDVTLQMFASPSARLRITRKLSPDGSYSLRISNVTPFKASVAFVPVIAITPGNLSLDVKMKPEANGLSVAGAGSVELEIMKDEAAGASELVRDLLKWLTGELTQ